MIIPYMDWRRKNFCLPRGRGGRGVQGGNSAAPERSAGAKRRRSVLLKEGSRIFKQRAPNWTSWFFVGGSRGLFAAPAGAARKELGGKIKRRGEIPRNNFFGNEAVRHNEVMYKNKFLFHFFAQNIPLRGIEAIFRSLANLSHAKI